MRQGIARATLNLVVMAAFAFAAPAQPASAQGGIDDLVPRAEPLDGNGVDMAGPAYRHREALLAIGDGGRGLDLVLEIAGPGSPETGTCFHGVTAIAYTGLSTHAYFGNTSPGIALYTAVLPRQNGKFGIYTSSGGRLPLIVVPSDDAYVTGAYSANHSQFNYVGGDGTEATFSSQHVAHHPVLPPGMFLDQVRYPDGETWTYRYNDANANVSGCYGKVSRVRSIVSSRGYALQFDYEADPAGTVTSPSILQSFRTVVRVTAYNKASIYCDEALLQSCASVTALTSAVTFAYGSGVTITKPNGETVVLDFTPAAALNLTSVTRPGGVTRTMTYEETNEQDGPTYRSLSTLTEAGRTWGYSLSPSYPGSYSTSRGEPGGASTRYDFSGGGPLPNEIMDPLHRLTRITYLGWTRVDAYTYPEGNRITAEYDGRGNRTVVRQHPRPNSGLPTLQAIATYPSACTTTDRRSCNQPLSTTDFNNNRTDFTYDPAHGGVLTETGPAVNPGSGSGAGTIRPQTRHTYAQRYAWIANGSGGFMPAATPIWVRTSTSLCRTSAATGNPASPCATTGDEVLIQFDYGPNSGPNTLLLRGRAVTATDGGITTTLRTCYGYDVNGRRISETQPNANLASCP